MFFTFLGLGIGLFAARADSEFAPGPQFRSIPSFKLLNQPVGNKTPPARTKRQPGLAGSSIAAFGDGALVVEPDTGTLILTDKAGAKVQALSIGAGASQLVVDSKSKLAYVADRNGDRIVVVSLAKGLTKRRTIATNTEPYGVALTPDRKTLLVTAVADRTLTGYRARDGKQMWSIDLPPEPRGVAVSPDGKEASVGFLTTGAIARVPLRNGRKDGTPRYVNIERQGPVVNRVRRFGTNLQLLGRLPSTKGAGRVFARNAFSVVYVGHRMTVVPHQQSTPVQATISENRGSYGGGASPPIEHRIAFVARRVEGREPVAVAQINLHQPRGAAYDSKLDRLFVSGYGSDDILILNNVSQPTIKLRSIVSVAIGHKPGCGPTGMALNDDGVLLVHCSLSRRVVRYNPNKWVNGYKSGPALVASPLSALQEKGRNMFRKGKDFRMSTRGAMACESCHPEARTDGLSWRIQGNTLQTPLLGGRVAGTHPFKWDGGDKTLDISLRSTVTRLGGRGITTNDAKALAAFLTSTKPPRSPKQNNKYAIARGKALFRSKTLKCASCHSGTKLTNQKSYDLAADMKKKVDTPSLLGLASSAPYYHDGSAASLRALLLENGTIHGMGKLKSLTSRNIDDLIAYLKTL